MTNQANGSIKPTVRVKSGFSGGLRVKSALKAGKIATNHNARLR